MKCNIIIVEDDLGCRTALVEALRDDLGHKVKEFRDLATFEQAEKEGTLLSDFDVQCPLIIILDIMLAKCLPADALHAPRWQGNDSPPGEKEDEYQDDTLGIGIADSIRNGRFPLIPKDTLMIFFTARQNDIIRDMLIGSPEIRCVNKPAFPREVQAAIEDLLRERRLTQIGE